ncbi:hypothetical protein [Herbaspirillum autotrophicum]|uniref:hypothetical protein n=1 Tax=Herbaspirillum autotrophicum TaxID=180195 RepID=UPI00067A9C84|nr:hypothetical protein [Herbaspirillum autotrophicum]
MANSFDDFVRQQTEKKQASENSTFSKEKELERWKAHLSELYKLTEAALDQYIQAGTVKTAYRKVRLVEQFSGPYEVDAMSIMIGTINVALNPIGTMLIGSNGRVDVVGPRGTRKLSLIRASARSAHDLISFSTGDNDELPSPPEQNVVGDPLVWKIADAPPNMIFHNLTHESLRDLLLKVANG